MPSNDNHLSSEQFEALLACLENKDADPERKDSAKDTLRGIFEENARLREGTTKDPMTGYANFQGLREAVEQERSRIERGQSKGFVLVALDLDKFKQVNDTHGHAAGDAVIIEFANRVENRLRPVDTLCHKSGDEFWVLATNTTLAEFEPIFDQTLVEITQDPMTYERKAFCFVPAKDMANMMNRSKQQFRKHNGNRRCGYVPSQARKSAKFLNFLLRPSRERN
jgi:diguanylate cyclase (GGDEF)-like protein